MSDSHGPRVVLVGPMGAGKTTVGRLLAERWGVPFRDTDDDVERADGRLARAHRPDEHHPWRHRTFRWSGRWSR